VPTFFNDALKLTCLAFRLLPSRGDTERFEGKVMAITGYEVNIVRSNVVTGKDELVPAYEQCVSFKLRVVWWPRIYLCVSRPARILRSSTHAAASL
jgi:hypothetical protein